MSKKKDMFGSKNQELIYDIYLRYMPVQVEHQFKDYYHFEGNQTGYVNDIGLDNFVVKHFKDACSKKDFQSIEYLFKHGLKTENC